MNKITGPRIIAFDVDDTLITWAMNDMQEHLLMNEGDRQTWVGVNKAMVEKLKSFSGCGYKIIVWSQSGEDWAWEVITKLGIEKYVDVVMTKPMYYADDLPADSWMKRIDSTKVE